MPANNSWPFKRMGKKIDNSKRLKGTHNYSAFRCMVKLTIR